MIHTATMILKLGNNCVVWNWYRPRGVSRAALGEFMVSTVSRLRLFSPLPLSTSVTMDEASVKVATSSVTMDESFVLPAPKECSGNLETHKDSETDKDFDRTTSDEERSSIYADWIDQSEQENVKIMAMLMYDNYRGHFGLLKMSAAKEVALYLGYSEKTVRRWRKDFIVGSRHYSVDGRGKYAQNIVINDKEYRDLALNWIHENAYVKGNPNMTAADFCT